MARSGDRPFAVRRRAPLGPGAKRTSLAAALPTAGRVAERILERLRPLSPVPLELAGSDRLGAEIPGSDVDLVAVGPAATDRERFLRDLAARISSEPWAGASRLLASSGVPRLRIEVAGTPADVQFATAGDPVLVEPQRILELVGARTPLEAYRVLVRVVKTWARAQELDRPALGGLGGTAWALLAAHVATRPDLPTDPAPEELLERLFDTFAGWPWPAPVALVPEASAWSPRGSADRMPVLTTSVPVANAARHVTRSTHTLLVEALGRARDEVRRIRRRGGSWGALFRPMPPTRGNRLFVHHGGGTDPAEVAGWVEGTVLSLVLDLEHDPELLVRPRAAGPEIVLELRGPLGGVPEAIESYLARFASWPSRPAHSHLEVRLARS